MPPLVCYCAPDLPLIVSVAWQEHEDHERFNPGWLEDDEERILFECVGACITPLCRQPGRVVVTFCRIYFQPFHASPASPTQSYRLSKVSPCKGLRPGPTDGVGALILFCLECSSGSP